MTKARTPFFSPRFRSRLFGHRNLRDSKIILIGLITWLGPAALILLLGLPFLVAGVFNDNTIWQAITSMTGLVVLSPFFGIFAVPVALLLGAWAMRFGIAGWVSAFVASAMLPTALGVMYQVLDPTAAAIVPMLILTPIVMLHAAFLWCATRWLCPDALLLSETA